MTDKITTKVPKWFSLNEAHTDYTSVVGGRSFSIYKNILAPARMSFNENNLTKYINLSINQLLIIDIPIINSFLM